jgi:hypothetical protein
VKKAPTTTEPPKADHPLFWAGYMLVDSGVVPEGQDKALAIPGLDAAAKDKPAQPANPPPPPPKPMLADRPAAEPPPDKRAKKTKSQPRASSKKPAGRQKPAVPDPSE